MFVSRLNSRCCPSLPAVPPPLLQPASGLGPLLFAGYEDGSLLLWDVTQRSELSRVKAHPEPVMCLTFDPRRLRGISGSCEKKLSPWMLDSQNNIQVRNFKPYLADLVMFVFRLQLWKA